ncbi:unnamed protein product [Miscanthus lutarioriparius]|uniref:ATP-dependent DNA helicase n=1 Tax=Miscanthus lutarioriparius TaxID=422564 RepID=A0A811MYZ9_9POAL|nr:unnamed protein product [Miscanthus lutarioriparius]
MEAALKASIALSQLPTPKTLGAVGPRRRAALESYPNGGGGLISHVSVCAGLFRVLNVPAVPEGDHTEAIKFPPLVTKKTAVVVSPLLSLMQDQVMSLKQKGVKSEYLGSTQMNSSVSNEAEKGAFDVLYMTPEKAISLPSRFWSNLQAAGICLLAVDEAHCISEWGHDFRMVYKQLHSLRDLLVGVPFVALTATATERVRRDISTSLVLRSPHVVVGSFDRSNLFYGVKTCNRSMSFISELVKDVSKKSAAGESTIIYCTTIRDTEQVHEALVTSGIRAGIYHGQMGSRAREESHRSFIRDEVLVMVATIAFGMGIDKPDVRCVIHYGCPKSLESYYQESGRCGRDGLPSVCWLYYQRSDFTKADFYCSEAKNGTQRKAIMDSFMAAQKYCLLATCRRRFLLQYFGEECNTDCGNCDNCTAVKNERDLSKEAFLLLSCIKSCGGRWGLNLPIDVLRGSRAKKIVDNNYDKLQMHGRGKDYSSNWWKALGGLLIAHDYLKETVHDTFRFVSVSPKGVKFLSTADKMDGTPLVFQLTAEMIELEEHGSSHHKEGGGLNPVLTLESEKISEDESKLYQMLLNVRMKLAQDIGTAPYAICGDQTIRNFAKMRPSTGARLANIDGVNQHFISRFSNIFIQNIAQLSKELNLPLDNSPLPPPTTNPAVENIAGIPKPLQNNLPGILGDAKLTAWELWHKQEYSFLKIAVTYDMIKTFLTIEGRGLSEQVFGNGTADGVPSRIAESPISSSHASEASRNDMGDGVPAAEASDANPSAKRGQTVSAEGPATKLQRIDEHGAKSTGTAAATEESVLALVASCNGVSLEDVAKHFKGSKRESVLEILEGLESQFIIYKRNGNYMIL